MILFIEVFEASLGVAIVADALAVGFVLFALIEIFGPICTAYFNPAVSVAMAIIKDISWKQATKVSLTQILGGLTGLLMTHLMFFEVTPTSLSISTVQRGGGSYIAEIVGTFILVLGILSLVHQHSDRISLVVGLLVGGMLLCTSSTMFANPQVTLARMLTDSLAGIHPVDGIVFIVMQFLGALLAVVIWKSGIKKTCIRQFL
jgi:glycerol uptake facilitator-like aquaporin